MTKKLIALLGLAVLFAPNADAARDTRRSQRGVRNVNISGTTTSINATVADTTIVSNDYTKPAPITDAVAKRTCTNLVVQGLTKFCGDKKCKNATEAYAGLVMPTNTIATSDIYCANFIEDAVNNLWNSYDSYALNETKNCNIALARSLAAEACYRYVLTMQNQKIRISEADLNEFCGKDAVITQYSQLSNGEKIIETEVGDNIATYFANVGKIGVSNLASYTRLLDLKIDFKTTEFPRDLIMLVNSLTSQGNMMCGEKNYTELKDANIQLIEKTGSLEKRIQEKGLAAGFKDWTVDQIGAFTGENWTEKAKAGKTETETETKKETEKETEKPAEPTVPAPAVPAE